MLNSKSFYFLISRQHMEFQSFLVATFVIILYRELEIPLFPLLQQKPSLLFLSPMQTNTHTHRDLPLGLPPSHAICQRGRVSIGGSFITALLTPRGDRCSWRPAELSMCVCVCWGEMTKERAYISPLPRVTPSTLRHPAWALCHVEVFIFKKNEAKRGEGGTSL